MEYNPYKQNSALASLYPYRPADAAKSYAAFLAGIFLVAATSSALGLKNPAADKDLLAKREAATTQLKQTLRSTGAVGGLSYVLKDD